MGHAMAYDSHRGKVVLLGGSPGRGKPAFGDTWEWDGKRWTKMTASGPAARADFAIAYDSRRQKVVLFGGQGVKQDVGDDRKDFSDTWTWDGKIWEKVSDSGPSARKGHCMAFDSGTGDVILYGGDAASKAPAGFELLQDMWRWDGKQWSEIKQIGTPPGKLDLSGMAYDKIRQRIVVYGGTRGQDLAEGTWEWDGKQWKQIG